MIEFMVDLETMGSGPTAAIVSIGCVPFDRESLTVLQDEFYTVVDLESSLKAGLTAESSTILWWMTQSEEARTELFSGRRAQLYEALSAFKYWVASLVPAKNDRRVWGNGAAFDNVILASAYKAVGLETPWNFWNDRCFRTMKNEFADVPLPDRSGLHHKAVDDARYQAECLVEILRSVRKR